MTQEKKNSQAQTEVPSPQREQVVLLSKEEPVSQTGSSARKKSKGIVIAWVCLCIVCACMILAFHAVRSGRLDHLIFQYRDGIRPAPEDSETVSLAKGFADYTGLGRPKNMESAFFHFSNAADKGSASAQYQVGIMLSRGEGARRDMEKALFWLRKAASQGHVNAQIALGTLYAEGAGETPQDKAEAENWLRALAGQGNTDTQAVLKDLEEDMVTETLPEEELLARAYASLEGW